MSASKLDSKPRHISLALSLANCLLFCHFASMSQTANTTVSTRADLEHLWAEQRRLNFVPTHPAHRGGMARFDSGVGMVSHATSVSYPHPANPTVGEYPGCNKVLSPTSPIKWKADDMLDLYQDVERHDPSRRAMFQRGTLDQ